MTIKEYFDKQDWKFAKTYAQFAPHEYIVRGKCNGSDDEFLRACRCILENDIRMFYYKHERKYLFVGGYYYWTMWDGESVSDDPTAVINRCKPEDYDIVFMKRGTQARKYQKSEQMKMSWEES